MTSELVLIADDEPSFLMPLQDHLEAEGYGVVTATDGRQALDLTLERHPDLLLLDIMMPHLSGLDVCRELMRRGATTPVIIVSARDQELDVVLGLELGADDYITKPFTLREVTARIRAVLRRVDKMKSPAAAQAGAVTIGAARVDFARYEASRNGKPVHLTPREYAVLHFLLEHQGDVVTREELLREVWGYDAFPTTRTVDNHLVRIRKVIEPDPARPKLLLSVRAVGYRLVMG
jgi:DNA-binding response OmpR family regulator